MDAHPAPSVDALVIKSAFDDVHLEGVPAAASRATSMDNRTPSSLLEEELFRGSVRGVTGTILEDRRLFVVLFLLLWACLAAFYGSGAKGGFSQEQEPEKQRDSRWDAVKCLAMFLVLYQHTWDWAHMVPWGSPEDEAASTADPKYIHLLPCRVMLPAFSFVSGVFASGTSSGSGDGSQVVMKQAKLQALFRDLVLSNLTIKPLALLVLLPHMGLEGNHKEVKTTVYFEDYWYLETLFLWQVFTPYLCMMHCPVAFSVALSLMVRGGSPPGTYMYFPFFVLGYVLSGGNVGPEERSQCRKVLEDFLSWSRSRVAAFCIIVPFVSVPIWGRHLSSSMEAMLLGHFGWGVSPWVDGGVLMDLASFVVWVPVVFAVVVLCFSLPQSNLVSSVGSSTLYIYILHFHIIREFSLASFFRQFVTESQFYVLIVFTTAFVMGLISCTLTKKVTAPLVQPQWLVDALFRKPGMLDAARKAKEADPFLK
eukprot:TRINITY_DN15912_c0_g1_i8.p1 TRINITY_DN15912_c0_g1~~TRINITY_DN15912_c0_g1_i8.p1  ORF type:complete len:480 (-),score=75.42 TRINITY_DN15912_c0_g1_i8:192-1631(-)